MRIVLITGAARFVRSGLRAARLRALVIGAGLGALALSTACNDGHKKMTSPPFESSSSRWNELSIPGVELYLESESAPPHRSVGAARVDGSISPLYGKPAFDAARAKAGDDPVALATLAMLFLDTGVAGKKPWTRVEGPQVPDEQAIARPPALTGDALVYWRFHAQTANLVRCQLALASGEIACKLGTELVQAERVGKDPAAAAKQDLASTDVNDRIRGIEALGHVKTDAARDQLVQLALNAYDFRERQAAVEILGKTGGGTGVVASLSRVLLFDQYVEVRQAAATALGTLRDPGGRDALQKASTGDANGRVQVLASEALKQLR